MPHMFRVDYCCNHINTVVESGRAIVMAESHQQALDIICDQFCLPPSRTRAIESVKVKPPIFSVDAHQSYPDRKISQRHHGAGR